jgi:hypothetical protein
MPIRLNTIQALRAEVERLGCIEYPTHGNWTVGQIFYHLAAAFEASVDGLPAGYSRFARLCIRPFRSCVTRIRFPPWLPIPRAIAFKLAPPEIVDCTEQHQRLLSAIDRFIDHEGPFPPHPVLGPLTSSEWTGFHLRHCQHHLAFIEADTSTSNSR